MSNINPTKSQVLSKVDSRFAKYYTKEIHRFVSGRFIKINDRKPNIEDADALMEIFKNTWGYYYVVLEKRNKNKKDSKVFYDYCVPLHIDVDKAIFGFMIEAEDIDSDTREMEMYPFTWIVENNRFEDFKEYIKGHSLELKHSSPRKRNKKVYEIMEDMVEDIRPLEISDIW